MDIDVSKENIQPLRGGRNLTQLGTALQAQSDVDAQRQLQLQKEEHEAAIRQYQGPDPLDPWFNYIQWVEQCYPKHGHEGHMDKLIKDCLLLFEKEERYYQDRRLVKLWIKYVDCLSNPLEIYQRLYTTGIGVECSEFYRAWACYCEESGDYKKANQVYMLGLQAQAQPLDELQQAHMNFQLVFAQRMLHDDSPTKRKAASALAETRMALTSLKSFKRRNIANVPIQRVGDSIRSAVPGVMRQQQGFDSRLPNSNIMVNIYEDAPSTSNSAVPVVENPGPASIVQSCNIENEKEIGIWTNAKTKMVHTTNVVPHQPLPFIPYEDEEDVLKLPANHMPYCADDMLFNVPLCVPDPVDPTKISCYNKALVYENDTEFSLEEIRSRKYNLEKKHIETVLEQPNVYNETVVQQQNASKINETLAQCSALETLANCALDAEQDHLGHLMPLTMPTLQNVTKITNMHSPGEPKVLVNLDSKEFSELTNKNDENQRPAPNVDKDNQINKPATSNNNYGNENACATYGKNNLMEEFNRSLMGNLLGDSITMNTKEARWELRNIFNDNEPSMVQPVVQQFDVSNMKFEIHEDRSMTMAAINSKNTHDIGDARTLLHDKENANKFNSPELHEAQNAGKNMYFEETNYTQVFNFEVKNATSTPNVSQFKKPASIDHSNKLSNVPKLNMDESTIEFPQSGIGKRDESSRQMIDQHATVDTQGAGLSVIMEATRESTSKSGSSSSGQSTRNNYTGYTTTPFDSMYHNNDQGPPTATKRNSISTQPRLANGHFASRAYTQKRERDTSEPKLPTPSAAPYASHDHQYQKPSPQSYNGYTPQRPGAPQMPAHGAHYHQNYSYQQGYSTNQAMNQQQGYVSPNPSAYNSPQHTGVQSPHHMSPSVPPGFQSPSYSNQYQTSAQSMMSPQQQAYAGHQDYHYNQTDRQHTFANQQQQPPVAAFQSPPHQSQYQNNQYYQRTSQVAAPQNQGYNQQNYHGMHNQYSNTNMYANQNYNSMQNPYRQSPKQVENGSAGYGVSNNQQFQIYQSPQPTQGPNNYRGTTTHGASNMTHDNSSEMQMKQETKVNHDQYTVNKLNPQSKPPVPHKSPTSALRNVRHDQPNVKIGQNSPDIGFSNQFLNFISNRNEPKDNANTPKFTNSPSISQKMHKNLYVSSPEQAQIPPSSGLSDSDSKDGLTAQTITPIQSAKVSHAIEKQKEISKRQLDFEQRAEFQSEDSRDSLSKESRISSVYSRQSDFQSDGYGMDVDSENSMECGTFKSTHSISLVETSDIPRPADIDFPEVIDPFNKKILASLLDYVKFPNKTHAEGYFEVRSVPKLQVATTIGVGSNRFAVEKQLGKGNYGAVFLCLDVHSNKSVAVKYQKPSRPWEFYICQEIKARIKDPFMLPGYMDITTGFIGENASLFVSEYSKYGSLLDVANKIRMATSKCINEFIVFLLTAEMLSIVHYLHKAQIIHADIKPDNFLLMKIPTQEWRTPSLQLIDLGCSIDMSLFPEGTTFRELIATEGFTCTEMREGKPWTYQTDLYCLAGTIHVILMGSYMKVASRLGQWNIEKKLPRYMKGLWDKIFTTLLNVPDCNNLPDLMELKNDVDKLLSASDNLTSQLRTFANVLKSR